MANYLNQQERQDLANELKTLNFNQARGKLRRIDRQGKLVYIRNVQNSGKWATRYDLRGLGTRVTLIESYGTTEKNGKSKADFELVEVIVEPTLENRT